MAESGVVVPTDELKTIIDKTAEHVAKNPTLEVKIIEKEAANPKFGFLRPGNPFYAYYRAKVREFRKAEGLPDTAGASAANVVTTSVAAAPSMEAIAREKLELKKKLFGDAPGDLDALGGVAQLDSAKPKKDDAPLEPPPPEQWILEPPSAVPLDMDIIKLTAQFTARNGPLFRNSLHARELQNPQFAFLNINHPLHPYFMRLVDAYTRVLLPTRDLSDLLGDLRLKDKLLPRVMKKVRFEKAQLKTEEDKRREEEEERERMASIDWNDFFIVETITFEETENLPAPGATTIKPDLIADVDMEDDTPAPVQTPAPQPKRPISKPGVKTAICPKCGQAIPMNEMEEHMKIELAGASRIGGLPTARPVDNKKASIAEGDEISATLRGIAQNRTDIFGVNDDEAEIGRALQLDEEKKRRAAVAAAHSWDGHVPGADKSEPYGRVNVNEQLRLIQERKGMLGESPTTLAGGPMPPAVAYPQPGMGMHNPMPSYQPPGGFQYGMPPVNYPQPGMYPQHAMAMDPSGKRPSPGGFEPEPPAKRQKTDTLLSEQEFLEQNPDPVALRIVVPAMQGEKSDWILDGRVLDVTLPPTASVTDLKTQIQQALNVPGNKQNLKVEQHGFLKDKFSMAFYNFSNGTEIALSLKERGGKKKQ